MKRPLEVLVLSKIPVVKAFIRATVDDFIAGKIQISPATSFEKAETKLKKTGSNIRLMMLTCVVESSGHHDCTRFIVRMQMKYPKLEIIVLTADPVAQIKADALDCKHMSKPEALKELKRRIK